MRNLDGWMTGRMDGKDDHDHRNRTKPRILYIKIGFVPLLPFIAMLGLILAVQGMNFPTENEVLLFLRNARKLLASQSPRAVMAEKLYDACLWCVIHMIHSKSAWIFFTHYPRDILPQKRPSESSKWDFAIFPQRNWESFGIYFSSVNSRKFAILRFTFIQNFDIKKMKRNTPPLRKFLHLGLGWPLEKRINLIHIGFKYILVVAMTHHDETVHFSFTRFSQSNIK